MWMAGVLFASMIPAAIPVLLWLRAMSGFGATSWRPMRRGQPLTPGSLPVCPLLSQPTLDALAEPRHPIPLTGLLLVGPPCWRSPCRNGAAKWEGGHGDVLDTDVPSGCNSDGAVTHIETCGSSCTAIARSPRAGRDTAPRPYLDPGGPAVDPSTSPVDEAWLAGGDLVDVIRATSLRDGWTEDEILRAQAKVIRIG